MEKKKDKILLDNIFTCVCGIDRKELISKVMIVCNKKSF